MKVKKTMAAAAIAATLAVQTVVPVYAEGTTNMMIDNTSPEVGDTVNVTVTGSENSTLTLKYNSSVFDVSGVNANWYAINGNTVTLTGTKGTVSFVAKDSGSSGMILSSDTLSGGSTTLTVGASQAQQEETTGESEAEPTVRTGAADYTVDGVDYTLSERFQEDTLPAGFTVERQHIHYYSYKVGKSADQDLTLVYLVTSANLDEPGSFYVYNEADDTVSPVDMIGDNESYVIPLTADDLHEDSLTAHEIVIQDASYTMYQLTDDASGLYYIYGVGADGTKWYSYNPSDETITAVEDDFFKTPAGEAQEEVEETTNETEEEPAAAENAEESNQIIDMLRSLPKNMQYLIGGIAALAILILIILAVRRRNKKRKAALAAKKQQQASMSRNDDEISLDENESMEETAANVEAMMNEAAEEISEEVEPEEPAEEAEPAEEVNTEAAEEVSEEANAEETTEVVNGETNAEGEAAEENAEEVNTEASSEIEEPQEQKAAAERDELVDAIEDAVDAAFKSEDSDVTRLAGLFGEGMVIEKSLDDTDNLEPVARALGELKHPKLRMAQSSAAEAEPTEEKSTEAGLADAESVNTEAEEKERVAEEAAEIKAAVRSEALTETEQEEEQEVNAEETEDSFVSEELPDDGSVPEFTLIDLDEL